MTTKTPTVKTSRKTRPVQPPPLPTASATTTTPQTAPASAPIALPKAPRRTGKGGSTKSAKPSAKPSGRSKPTTLPKSDKSAQPTCAKRVSALDAAAQIISSAKEPMRATDLVTQMEIKGLWKSPGGKTPEATLYAAIIREIAAKGKLSRFKRHDRGLFVAGKVG